MEEWHQVPDDRDINKQLQLSHKEKERLIFDPANKAEKQGDDYSP
jgi:hypothetical protein